MMAPIYGVPMGGACLRATASPRTRDRNILKYNRCFHHIYSYFREDNFHKNEKDFKTFAPNSDASSNLLCIYQEGWPDCANNISRIEAAILNRELVQVTNQTMSNASVPICNLTPMEANDDTRAWCA